MWFKCPIFWNALLSASHPQSCLAFAYCLWTVQMPPLQISSTWDSMRVFYCANGPITSLLFILKASKLSVPSVLTNTTVSMSVDFFFSAFNISGIFATNRSCGSSALGVQWIIMLLLIVFGFTSRELVVSSLEFCNFFASAFAVLFQVVVQLSDQVNHWQLSEW